MKISISIFGRFHFFDLAKQFTKKNTLHSLISTFPYFKAKEWGIRRQNFKSILIIEIIKRIFYKFKLYNVNVDLNFKKVYGFFSNMLIKNEIDVFIFFAGNGYNSKVIKRLKKNKVLCIPDEGSAHILTRKKIMDDEYKRLGFNFKENHSKELINETLLEYDLADYISVPSKFVKNSMIENGINQNKIIINPYGVDLNQFKQSKKKDHIFRVIFCGSLSIRKGSHFLLKAISELNLKNFEFWHIGNIYNEMNHFIRKYVSPNIQYKGMFKQSELSILYSQGSIFCMPSLEEGLAMVQLQAMACGLPLICTPNSGGDDLITNQGEEGFVIPIKDSEAIKEKIKYLYENPSICKEMGSKAKLKIKRGFTWDDYGNRYTETLKNFLNNAK